MKGPFGKHMKRRNSIVALVVGVWSAVVCAATEPATVESPLSFPASVDLMLRQSPLVKSGELGVSIEKLGESDSRARYLPQFSLSTRYYLDQPEGSDQAYTLAFVVDPYNPIEAHLSLRARKLLTHTAILSHMQTVAEGLHRVAQGFLDLDALGQMEAIESDLLQTLKRRNAALKIRFDADAVSDPEMQAADQEAQIVRLQRARSAAARKAVVEGLAAFIGLAEDPSVSFQSADAEPSVLGGFDPDARSWEAIRADSLERRIQEAQRELQALRITAARAAYIPDVLVGLQTPDPLSGYSDDSFYLSVGLDIPLWDGLTRARDVTRQRQALQRLEAAGNLQTTDARARWRAAEDACRATEIEWRSAVLQEGMALTKSQKAEWAATAGGTGDEALSARLHWLQARLLTVRRQCAYSKARLQLRLLSGDLLNTTCNMKAEEL